MLSHEQRFEGFAHATETFSDLFARIGTRTRGAKAASRAAEAGTDAKRSPLLTRPKPFTPASPESLLPTAPKPFRFNGEETGYAGDADRVSRMAKLYERPPLFPQTGINLHSPTGNVDHTAEVKVEGEPAKRKHFWNDPQQRPKMMIAAAISTAVTLLLARNIKQDLDITQNLNAARASADAQQQAATQQVLSANAARDAAGSPATLQRRDPSTSVKNALRDRLAKRFQPFQLMRESLGNAAERTRVSVGSGARSLYDALRSHDVSSKEIATKIVILAATAGGLLGAIIYWEIEYHKAVSDDDDSQPKPSMPPSIPHTLPATPSNSSQTSANPLHKRSVIDAPQQGGPLSSDSKLQGKLDRRFNPFRALRECFQSGPVLEGSRVVRNVIQTAPSEAKELAVKYTLGALAFLGVAGALFYYESKGHSDPAPRPANWTEPTASSSAAPPPADEPIHTKLRKRSVDVDQSKVRKEGPSEHGPVAVLHRLSKREMPIEQIAESAKSAEDASTNQLAAFKSPSRAVQRRIRPKVIAAIVLASTALTTAGVLGISDYLDGGRDVHHYKRHIEDSLPLPGGSQRDPPRDNIILSKRVFPTRVGEDIIHAGGPLDAVAANGARSLRDTDAELRRKLIIWMPVTLVPPSIAASFSYWYTSHLKQARRKPAAPIHRRDFGLADRPETRDKLPNLEKAISSSKETFGRKSLDAEHQPVRAPQYDGRYLSRNQKVGKVAFALTFPPLGWAIGEKARARAREAELSRQREASHTRASVHRRDVKLVKRAWPLAELREAFVNFREGMRRRRVAEHFGDQIPEHNLGRDQAYDIVWRAALRRKIRMLVLIATAEATGVFVAIGYKELKARRERERRKELERQREKEEARQGHRNPGLAKRSLFLPGHEDIIEDVRRTIRRIRGELQEPPFQQRLRGNLANEPRREELMWIVAIATWFSMSTAFGMWLAQRTIREEQRKREIEAAHLHPDSQNEKRDLDLAKRGLSLADIRVASEDAVQALQRGFRRRQRARLLRQAQRRPPTPVANLGRDSALPAALKRAKQIAAWTAAGSVSFAAGYIAAAIDEKLEEERKAKRNAQQQALQPKQKRDLTHLQDFDKRANIVPVAESTLDRATDVDIRPWTLAPDAKEKLRTIAGGSVGLAAVAAGLYYTIISLKREPSDEEPSATPPQQHKHDVERMSRQQPFGLSKRGEFGQEVGEEICDAVCELMCSIVRPRVAFAIAGVAAAGGGGYGTYRLVKSQQAKEDKKKTPLLHRRGTMELLQQSVRQAKRGLTGGIVPVAGEVLADARIVSGNPQLEQRTRLLKQKVKDYGRSAAGGAVIIAAGAAGAVGATAAVDAIAKAAIGRTRHSKRVAESSSQKLRLSKRADIVPVAEGTFAAAHCVDGNPPLERCLELTKDWAVVIGGTVATATIMLGSAAAIAYMIGRPDKKRHLVSSTPEHVGFSPSGPPNRFPKRAVGSATAVKAASGMTLQKNDRVLSKRTIPELSAALKVAAADFRSVASNAPLTPLERQARAKRMRKYAIAGTTVAGFEALKTYALYVVIKDHEEKKQRERQLKQWQQQLDEYQEASTFPYQKRDHSEASKASAPKQAELAGKEASQQHEVRHLYKRADVVPVAEVEMAAAGEVTGNPVLQQWRQRATTFGQKIGNVAGGVAAMLGIGAGVGYLLHELEKHVHGDESQPTGLLTKRNSGSLTEQPSSLQKRADIVPVAEAEMAATIDAAARFEQWKRKMKTLGKRIAAVFAAFAAIFGVGTGIGIGSHMAEKRYGSHHADQDDDEDIDSVFGKLSLLPSPKEPQRIAKRSLPLTPPGHSDDEAALVKRGLSLSSLKKVLSGAGKVVSEASKGAGATAEGARNTALKHAAIGAAAAAALLSAEAGGLYALDQHMKRRKEDRERQDQHDHHDGPKSGHPLSKRSPQPRTGVDQMLMLRVFRQLAIGTRRSGLSPFPSSPEAQSPQQDHHVLSNPSLSSPPQGKAVSAFLGNPFWRSLQEDAAKQSAHHGHQLSKRDAGADGEGVQATRKVYPMASRLPLAFISAVLALVGYEIKGDVANQDRNRRAQQFRPYPYPYPPSRTRQTQTDGSISRLGVAQG